MDFIEVVRGTLVSDLVCYISVPFFAKFYSFFPILIKTLCIFIESCHNFATSKFLPNLKIPLNFFKNFLRTLHNFFKTSQKFSHNFFKISQKFSNSFFSKFIQNFENFVNKSGTCCCIKNLATKLRRYSWCYLRFVY